MECKYSFITIPSIFPYRKLNTGIHANDWKNWKKSKTSFSDCTGNTSNTSVEDFLDKVVIPKIAQTSSETRFESIIGSTSGPVYCALTLIHSSKEYYAGIVFSYFLGNAVLFTHTNEGYGIKFL